MTAVISRVSGEPLPAPPEGAARVRELIATGTAPTTVFPEPSRARATLEKALREADALHDRELLTELMGAFSDRPVSAPTTFIYAYPYEALQWQQHALRLAERLKAEPKTRVQILSRAGLAAQLAGRLTLSREYLFEALREDQRLSAKASGPSPRLLGTLGLTLLYLGDGEASYACFSRQLEARRRTGDVYDVMATLHNMSLAAQEMGDRVEQERLIGEIQALSKRYVTPLPPLTALTLSILKVEKGDLAESRRLVEYAQKQLTAEWGESVWTPAVYERLAAQAEAEGNLAEAQRYLALKLEVSERQSPSSEFVASTFLQQARLDLRQGKVDSAESRVLHGWEMARGELHALTSDESRQAIAGKLQEYTFTLAQVRIAQGNPRLALAAVEEGRAAATQALLAERRLLIEQLSPALRAEYDQALTEEQEAASALLAPAKELAALEISQRQSAPDLKSLEMARDRVTAARQRYFSARLRREEVWGRVRKSLTPRLQPELAAVDLEGPLSRLPAGNLYLSYSVGPSETLLFLAGKAPKPRAGATIRLSRINVSAKDLTRQVQAYSEALTQARGGAITLSRQLAATLLPKEIRAEIGGSNRLILSPDGPLWELSFSSLVTSPEGAPPKYLGLQKGIVLTRSLALYDSQRRARPALAPGKQPTVLALGDPAFGDRKDRPLPDVASSQVLLRGLLGDAAAGGTLRDETPVRLPGTRDEAKAVAGVYGVTPLTGSAATESEFRRRAASADVIHLATHGYFHPYLPMSSGIFLAAARPAAPQATSNNDGALQAWEIFAQLNLRAEIVVLAGCETGRGKNVRNEGLIGLTRALQYAGARSVLASLWRVRDDSTQALTPAFHQGLRAGLTKDEALRRAMAQVAARPKWAHPYCWSGFVLVGDPENPVLGRTK